VRRIFLDIALIDSIGEHPTKKPDVRAAVPEPTFHNRFAAFVAVFWTVEVLPLATSA